MKISLLQPVGSHKTLQIPVVCSWYSLNMNFSWRLMNIKKHYFLFKFIYPSWNLYKDSLRLKTSHIETARWAEPSARIKGQFVRVEEQLCLWTAERRADNKAKRTASVEQRHVIVYCWHTTYKGRKGLSDI